MFKEFSYYLYEMHTGDQGENNKFFRAIIGISFLNGINVLALSSMLNHFFTITLQKNTIIILCALLYFSLLFLNYLLIYKKRNDIIKQVENYSPKRENRGKILFVIYIFATFILFAVVKEM
jgi:small-conductance mechanosensitive channel